MNGGTRSQSNCIFSEDYSFSGTETLSKLYRVDNFILIKEFIQAKVIDLVILLVLSNFEG